MTIAEEVDDAVRALRRESYVANRSVFAERMRAYYACKAESLKAARRDRYRLNREQEKSNARAHYYRNRAAILAQKKVYYARRTTTRRAEGRMAGDMEYIRKTYGVPAKRGGVIEYTDPRGQKWRARFVVRVAAICASS